MANTLERVREQTRRTRNQKKLVRESRFYYLINPKQPLMAHSSSGQDAGLSRRKQGFDSPMSYHI